MLSILLSVFMASFAGIVVMLCFRAWEIKKGKAPVPQTKGSFLRFNPRPLTIKEEHMHAVSRHALKHGKTAAKHAVRIARNSPLTRHITKTVNLVKGRNGITKKETASPFLKSVSEYKKQMRGGE